ncbi:hypothetical protein QTJ16_003643 [Diplocarpon rosae]|uniref:Uncharacterized protein n=1 Tax=Diplocarpon rosae TaxID=946125 RepID=A0AAD9SXQ4_9HELO|nr:hypothetical protein QTJ16_003643 [Diplocarpon rosae]PBP28213.1 hypothetical protein BUE80_DR000790 [Diplocarpon rosae]
MLPLLKRLLFPLVAVFLVCILLFKTAQTPDQRYPARLPKFQEPERVPIAHRLPNGSNHSFQEPDFVQPTNSLNGKPEYLTPIAPIGSRTVIPRALTDLAACPRAPNRFTGHIRLPNLMYNISMKADTMDKRRTFWNPTIFALPYWAKNQYIIVSMLTPHGETSRRNVLCEANICHPRDQRSVNSRENHCTEEDLELLGPNGGMRCVTPPIAVDVPPTPAERCSGVEQDLADIPGFHDPRIFYSGRGEPILMVASQSRYACIGLWVIDLRVVYPAIEETFSSSPHRLGPGPLMSYPTLTELTRSPPSTRQSYEKNWVMFFPSPATSFLQYELSSSTRTFAQLVAGGLTTQNLTDPFEEPCLADPSDGGAETNAFTRSSTWHQATPSLKLTLCPRTNISCLSDDPATVFFAAIQRKHCNDYGLPIRYERYFVVWSANWPFNMLAVSQHPILMANETNRGWKPAQIWDDVPQTEYEAKDAWGDFTYTTTIAYAWGRPESDIREKSNGYLDDDVILSVGIDDQDGLYSKIAVEDLLQCLRICPGRA